MEVEDNNFSARTSSPMSARGSSYPRVHQGNRHGSAVHNASWKKSSAYLAHAKFGSPSSVRSSCSPHVSSIRNMTREVNFALYVCFQEYCHFSYVFSSVFVLFPFF